MTDRLIVKLKEKELHCVYLNEFSMAIAAFVLQGNEAKSWYDGLNKARHIYTKLKQDVDVQTNKTAVPQDSISIKKSPLGSSIGKTILLCFATKLLLLKT